MPQENVTPFLVCGSAKPKTLMNLPSEPAGGAWTLGYPGTPATIRVRQALPPLTDELWAIVHEIGEHPAPGNDPGGNGYTQLMDVGQADLQAQVPIPVEIPCPYEAPSTNNLAVSIARKKTTSEFEHYGEVQFKYICPSFSVIVPGWACPWFAFSTLDDGPEGESVEAHRPERVRIPANAATVTITANGWWRHQPIDQQGDRGGSGPNGYGSPQPLVNAVYQQESGGIALPDDPQPLVNTLVGVLDPRPGSTEPKKILKLGSGPTALTASQVANSRAIFLGLWDGRQWNAVTSNSGEVTVSFNWAPG